MERTDVIVVGGGPAGSTCAWRLVQAGARVRIVDAATFPRDKVCAGWITPQVVAALRLDVDHYREARTFQPLEGFDVGCVGDARRTSVNYGRTVSAAIRRCEFDAYLLARSGAIVESGTPVTSLVRDAGEWVVNGRWAAPVLVGAGGSNCPVARLLNGPGASGALQIVAREVEFVLDPGTRTRCGVQGSIAELYFTADVLGYGWCVRKGDVMNVGIGRLDRRLTRGDTEAFARFVAETRGVVTPVVDRWRGHAYLAGASRHRRRTGDGVLLVGDAAGLADERSGEGIGPAVESGLMAASVIVTASGEVGEARLSAYDALIAERWQRHHPWQRLARAVPSGLARHAGVRLLRVPAFVRTVVLDRWFLHVQDPVTSAV